MDEFVPSVVIIHIRIVHLYNFLAHHTRLISCRTTRILRSCLQHGDSKAVRLLRQACGNRIRPPSAVLVQLSIQLGGIQSCRIYSAVVTLQIRSSTALNLLSLAASLLLGGCAPAPSIAVLGAAFPDWLFCIVFGVLATVVVHVVLGKRGKRACLAPAALSYPALCALLAMAFWLLVFSH